MSDNLNESNSYDSKFRNDGMKYYQEKPDTISFELPIAQLCYYYDYDGLLLLVLILLS